MYAISIRIPFMMFGKQHYVHTAVASPKPFLRGRRLAVTGPSVPFELAEVLWVAVTSREKESFDFKLYEESA